jgi:N,N-dimethylformamidase beta subunit-like protein
VTRVARVAFGVLVLATLAAFVVTQKLKSAPPLVVRPHLSAVFSPTAHGRLREARISFWIVHADDVSVSIVDGDERIVRTLVDGRHLAARRRITRFWDGRSDAGALAPDGRYRVRVALLGQGRTIDLPPQIALDTTPPRPRVAAIAPRTGSGPAFLPRRGVRAVTIHVRGTEGRRARLLIWRTDVTPPRQVGQLTIPIGHDTVQWDGTLAGVPAPAGTYLMGVLVADRAGNVGTFPARLPPQPGERTPGAGVTIRRLAVAPPLTPVAPGAHATAFVDARGHRYEWALRRSGDAKVLAHGVDRGARLRLRVPRQQAGLDVLTVVTRDERTSVPLAVRASRPHSVLVVLPALTWQGRNPVDDDGDGMPDTLETGSAVALARPFAHGVPGDVSAEGALLRVLDANLLRYDVTTDLALTEGAGPALGGYRGVVLAGDERWITPALGAQLRAYVRRGGRLWSLGVDSLRRTVRLGGGTLSDPSSPRLVDALGARPRQPLVTTAQPATMTIYRDGPLGLFHQTSGAFAGYRVYEALAPFAAPAKLVAAAGPAAGNPVIAAWQLGTGFAVHTGLPELPARALAHDLDAGALVQRIFTLLAAPR